MNRYLQAKLRYRHSGEDSWRYLIRPGWQSTLTFPADGPPLRCTRGRWVWIFIQGRLAWCGWIVVIRHSTWKNRQMSLKTLVGCFAKCWGTRNAPEVTGDLEGTVPYLNIPRFCIFTGLISATWFLLFVSTVQLQMPLWSSSMKKLKRTVIRPG